MKFSIGDRVEVSISLSLAILRGSRGMVKRVIAGGTYEVRFDERPDGAIITPPIVGLVDEEDLNEVGALAVAAAANQARFAVLDRVRILISVSSQILAGSKGTVRRVIAGGCYEVDFDEKPDGAPISPPVPDIVTEADLAAT
jgi:hypothetical protein